MGIPLESKKSKKQSLWAIGIYAFRQFFYLSFGWTRCEKRNESQVGITGGNGLQKISYNDMYYENKVVAFMWWH